ncbi:iron ABC transporter permease [bacterium]|nr:iron ABC transporter permease [bacterium]
MNKSTRLLTILLALAVALFFVAPMVGISSISPFISEQEPVLYKIFWHIRFPRVLVGFVGGAILAISGVVFQSIYRNDLASPYTLGVSGGAGVGAALAILLSLPWLYQPLFAFGGAMIPMAIIYIASTRMKRIDPAILILAGVAIQISSGGIVLFLHYVADRYQSAQMMQWVMGSLDVVSYRPGIILSVAALLLFFVVIGLHRELDLLSLGSDFAHSRGVAVSSLIHLLFIVVSFTVALLISFVGPIGFVGLIAPHIFRRFGGGRHIFLIPGAALLGGIMLVLSDTFARTLLQPEQIPVGVITALAGGPFFLWALLKKR